MPCVRTVGLASVPPARMGRWLRDFSWIGSAPSLRQCDPPGASATLAVGVAFSTMGPHDADSSSGCAERNAGAGVLHFHALLAGLGVDCSALHGLEGLQRWAKIEPYDNTRGAPSISQEGDVE